MHLLCRNEESGQEAIAGIKKLQPDAKLILHQIDVSSPKDLVSFSRKFPSGTLDILINNAGCMVPAQKQDDGLDINFATNTMGPFILTELIMDKMLPASRVIMVCSGGMFTESLSLDFDNAEKVSPVRFYARNKRQQQVLAECWARKYPHLKFFAVSPGWADTKAVSQSMPEFYATNKAILRTPAQGADSILWAAISVEGTTLPSGSYIEGNYSINLIFIDRRIMGPHFTGAFTQHDPSLDAQFMAKLEEMADRLIAKYRQL